VKILQNVVGEGATFLTHTVLIYIPSYLFIYWFVLSEGSVVHRGWAFAAWS